MSNVYNADVVANPNANTNLTLNLTLTLTVSLTINLILTSSLPIRSPDALRDIYLHFTGLTSASTHLHFNGSRLQLLFIKARNQDF